MRFEVEREPVPHEKVVGQFRYRWVAIASNNRVICYSRWYPTKQSSENALTQFRRRLKPLKGDLRCGG